MPLTEYFLQLQHRCVSFLRTRNARLVAAGLAVFLLFGVYYVFMRSASGFPENSVVTVGRGVTVSQTASFFKEKHFVSSATLMSFLVRVLSRGRGAIAGDYYFPAPESLFRVSLRIATGDYAREKVKVTIPEGSTAKEIAKILDAALPSFDSNAFLAAAKGHEGYLFPDTYQIPVGMKPDDIVMMMETDFTTQTRPIADKIAAFGKPLADVVTMASILEGEARLLPTKQIISGILWRRIALGMPLQVDAAFEYINGKNTSTLTLADLKIDSPYNTYIHTGLPPTPISNPGLDSILAAVTPTKTNYLYFLTDANGVMHYATTLAEHNANKAKYLQ